ncbi:hypothetical protein ACFQ3Z_43710 [Streptomyces nogalater]
MIALVNPVSSGVFLSAAFRERGEECLLVYDGHFAAAAEDGGPGRRVIHRDVHSTARLLRDLRVRHVVPGSEAGRPRPPSRRAPGPSTQRRCDGLGTV